MPEIKIARAHYRWKNHQHIQVKKKLWHEGIVFFDNEVLSKVGGYSEYRVSGDVILH